MQIDHEIKLPAAHVFDELNDSHNRQRLESVAQANAIDGDNFVRVAGHLDDFIAGFTNGHGELCVRKSLTSSPQCRQAHNDVAELAEIDNEDIARFEGHFKCLSKNSALA